MEKPLTGDLPRIIPLECAIRVRLGLARLGTAYKTMSLHMYSTFKYSFYSVHFSMEHSNFPSFTHIHQLYPKNCPESWSVLTFGLPLFLPA